MPIELPELMGYLGVDPSIESLDAFKETFDATFQKREEVKTFQGRVLSSNRNGILKLAKELELEDAIDKDGLNKSDKPWEQTRTLIDKLKERHEAEIEAAKGTGGQADPEVLKKLEAKEKRVKELELALGNQAAEFEGYKGEITKKEQARILDGYRGEAVKAVKFDASVDELKRDGFLARMASKYTPALDDEGKPVALDGNGEKVKDPKKHGAYLDLATLYAQEAEKLNLTTKNANGNRVVTQVRQSVETQVRTVDRSKRPVSPRALG
jgi:hypothetical protein